MRHLCLICKEAIGVEARRIPMYSNYMLLSQNAHLLPQIDDWQIPPV